MTTTTKRDELIREAAQIAGCGWDDYAPDADPATKCRACADATSLGSDCDYSPAERRRLRELADMLEQIGQ